MNVNSLPSLVNNTPSNNNWGIYDVGGSNYKKDIRTWGYVLPETLPEVVAQVLRGHKDKIVATSQNGTSKIRILDAGAGDGLSGMAMRKAGWDKASTYIAGNDISHAMLNIAKHRQCYDDIKVVDLNEGHLPYSTDEFDLVKCTGNCTSLDIPKSKILEEFVRVTRPGGIICYTNRTENLSDWKEAELELERNGYWHPVGEPVGPIPYILLNNELGKDTEIVIFLYQVSNTKHHR